MPPRAPAGLYVLSFVEAFSDERCPKPFLREQLGLRVHSDLGFKEVFAPLSLAFKCRATTASISEVKA